MFKALSEKHAREIAKSQSRQGERRVIWHQWSSYDYLISNRDEYMENATLVDQLIAEFEGGKEVF